MCLNNHRKLKYSQAINEAFHQAMELDESVFLIGQGVDSPWYVGNTTSGLKERFGPLRLIDTPVSENAVTGAAVGAAIVGMKPIVVHPRMDFITYAMDPIINEAANWHYMFGGKSCVPVVIWGIINRGGEQGAQHSQALHGLFAHIPGLKVVMPSNPYEAKGLMISAINDPNPVIYVDDRWLYSIEGVVPEKIYEIPIGKGLIIKEGKDISVVTCSYQVHLALEAAAELQRNGIDIEIVNIRTIKPLDENLILSSVSKTGRLIVIDGGWKSFGLASEIISIVTERVFDKLKSPPIRITLPDVPAPTSSLLEKNYYPDAASVFRVIKKVFD